MTEKFKNRYRIPSARAAWWCYGWAGAYFITICTAQRQHFFGEISEGKMVLSSLGQWAEMFWYEIPQHAHDVELGAFVVMPNHVHGILILNPTTNDPNDPNDPNVETRHALSLPLPRARFQNQGKNTISSMVGGYKSAMTKYAHRQGFEFAWQSRFHDRIIRDDPEYQRINDYIETNPARWEHDRFYHPHPQSTENVYDEPF